MFSQFKTFTLAAGLLIVTQQAKCSSKNTSAHQESQPEDFSTAFEKPVNKDGLLKPTGIYVASEWNTPIGDYVLANPDVDGVFLRMRWGAFQPQKDKYNWEFLDSELNRITKAGKKFSIGVMAGSRCPKWIYDEGVTGYDFKEFPSEGNSDFEIEAKIPAPWDKQYLNFFTGFIKELANHIRSNPAWYNNLTVVKITGINRATIELRLPAQKSIKNKKGELSSDAYAIWKQAGYKPKLVKEAWTTLTNCFSENFPDKYLSLAFIFKKGFPYIDDNGNEMAAKPENDIAGWFIEDGFKRFGKRFVVQYNALDVSTGNHAVVQRSAQKGNVTGYQLLQQTLAKPECLDNPKIKCDEAMFKKVLENGMKDGVSFIEIFPLDVKAYPKSIKYGHEKMNGNKSSK